MSRRAAGLGSSPSFSTKKKTQLWKQLRKLDALCEMYKPLKLKGILFHLTGANDKMFIKYDLKRKEVRSKLKSAGQVFNS